MKNGFTLVEMAIVLVIMGLLVGGILAGQSLISAAKRQKLISELNDNSRAITTFYTKFNELPGDFFNAPSFLGSTTIGGDGSGVVDRINSGALFEGALAWEHLALAGMVKGEYSRFPIAWPGAYTADTNAPLGAYGHIYTITGTTATPIVGRLKNYKVALCGDDSAVTGNTECSLGNQSGMSAEDANSVDTKIDNGFPASGRIQFSYCNTGAEDFTTMPINSTSYAFDYTVTTPCGFAYGAY